MPPVNKTKEETPSVAPFWERIPKFFMWPMQFGPLVQIGILSAGTMVAAILPGLGRLLMIAIWFYFFRYAMTALVQTARGNLDPETVDNALEEGDRRPVKQSAFLIVALLLVLVSAVVIGPKFALMFGVLVTLALPAAIIVIAIHDSLLDALNPLQILGVIGSIGAPYFLLCLFLLMLEGGDIALFRIVGPMIPDLIELPITTFLSMYFLLVMYNMMGYVVYQYHEKLGYAVDKAFDENAPEQKSGPVLSPRDQKIADLVKAGEIGDAIEVLKDDMRYTRNDIADNQKLHKLYLALGDAEKTIPHARQLLGWLLAGKQGGAALDLLLRVRGIDPAFAPEGPDAILPLAEAAKAKRDGALAMEFIKGFDKKYPGHRDIPAVYFLAAQLLSELQRDDRQAMRILQALVAKYPDAGVTPEATVYLRVLEKTTGAAPA